MVAGEIRDGRVPAAQLALMWLAEHMPRSAERVLEHARRHYAARRGLGRAQAVTWARVTCAGVGQPRSARPSSISSRSSSSTRVAPASPSTASP